MGRQKKNIEDYDKIYNNQESDSDYEDEKYYNSIPDYRGSLPNCPNCGAEMRYNYINSKYKCFSCGHEVDEYDIPFDDEPDDMPYCCKSCGGPWPSCKTSCKIFDD